LKERSFLQEVFGVDPNKPSRADLLGNRIKQTTAKIKLTDEYQKVSNTKTFKFITTPQDNYFTQGAKFYIASVYAVNKIPAVKMSGSENKIVRGYGKSMSFVSDVAGSYSSQTLKTYSTPGNWILVGATTGIAGKIKPIKNFFSDPFVSSGLTGTYFGVVGLSSAVSTKPAITLGQGIGKYVGYSSIAYSYTGLKTSGTNYLKNEYKNFRRQYQDFTFGNLQRNNQLNYDYYNLEGSGQRTLFGQSIKTPKPIGNQFKIGYGIEKNTLRQPGNLVQPTGQTRLAKDQIFTIDLSGKKNFVLVDSNKNVFAFDSSIGKYVEYTPQKFKIFTQNPKYNIFSPKTENIYKPEIFFKDVSTQTTLNGKKLIIDLTNIKVPSFKTTTTTPSTKLNIPKINTGSSKVLLSNPTSEATNFVGASFRSSYSGSTTFAPDVVSGGSYVSTQTTPSQPIITNNNNFLRGIDSTISYTYNQRTPTSNPRKPNVRIDRDSVFSLPIPKINNKLSNFTNNDINTDSRTNISQNFTPKIDVSMRSRSTQDQKTIQITTPGTITIPGTIGGFDYNIRFDPVKPQDPKDPDPIKPINLEFPRFNLNRGKKSTTKGIKSTSKYRPSLEAIAFNIKGIKPSTITPFSIRPITTSKNKSKTRKKKK